MVSVKLVGGSFLVPNIGSGINTSLPNGSNSVSDGGCKPNRRLLRLGCDGGIDGSIVDGRGNDLPSAVPCFES